MKSSTRSFLWCWVLVWLGVATGFVLLLNFASLPTGDGQWLALADYQQRFIREMRNTLLLVVPALLATVLLAMVWHLGNKVLVKMSQGAVSLFNTIPTLLSALPLFISGIFFIRYLKLDTLNSHNFFYGILCLATFNLSYFFRRSQQKITEAYAHNSVLYATSLGYSQQTLFRHYIFPAVLRDHLVILRELLPHLFVESVIIEYTFSYTGLMRSAVQAIQHGDWHYCLIFVIAFGLFLAAFDIVFRYLESFFPVDERGKGLANQ